MHGYRVYSQSVSEILSVTGFLHIVWIGFRLAVIIFPFKVLVISLPAKSRISNNKLILYN